MKPNRIIAIFMVVCVTSVWVGATIELKQSTATYIIMGPFVDADDGITPKSALALVYPDVKISKAGADFNSVHNTTSPVPDVNGFYRVYLDATDTDTLGPFAVEVNFADTAPVWQVCQVVSAGYYNFKYGTTPPLVDVNLVHGQHAVADHMNTVFNTYWAYDWNDVTYMWATDVNLVNGSAPMGTTDVTASVPTAADNGAAAWTSASGAALIAKVDGLDVNEALDLTASQAAQTKANDIEAAIGDVNTAVAAITLTGVSPIETGTVSSYTSATKTMTLSNDFSATAGAYFPGSLVVVTDADTGLKYNNLISSYGASRAAVLAKTFTAFTPTAGDTVDIYPIIVYPR